MSTVKEGKVHLCPNCGANIGAFMSVCPECGHEIRDNKSSDAVMTFADKYMNEKDEERQAKLVEAFPVPNNKEDLLEFMSMAGPQAANYLKMAKGTKLLICIGLILIAGLTIALCTTAFASDATLGNFGAGFIILLGVGGSLIAVNYGGNGSDPEKAMGEKRLAIAWASKMDQVRNKAKMLSVADPTFAKQMNIISSAYNRRKKSPSILLGVIWGVVICLIVALCFAASSRSSNDKDKEAQIVELMNTGEYDAAADLKKELLPSGAKDEADDMYFSFLAQCVRKMCKEGKEDEARTFISAHVLYFDEDNKVGFTTIGIDRATAEQKLNDIVDNQ